MKANGISQQNMLHIEVEKIEERWEHIRDFTDREPASRADIIDDGQAFIAAYVQERPFAIWRGPVALIQQLTEVVALGSDNYRLVMAGLLKLEEQASGLARRVLSALGHAAEGSDRASFVQTLVCSCSLLEQSSLTALYSSQDFLHTGTH